MGGKVSVEEKNIFASKMFDAAQSSGVIPVIGIDKSLLMFSGLDSTAVLEQYSSSKISILDQKEPDYGSIISSALDAFTGVPNAVGIGAFIISLLIDIATKSLVKVEQYNTMDMIRRVFADEKASGVRDSIDEYIKRLDMFMKEPKRALEETARLEKQLSEQLTRLRNSMLHDKQMSSRSMKYWTNGAAFHLQMLAHEARLNMAGYGSEDNKDLGLRVTSINSVADRYQRNLEELLKKYKTYQYSNLHVYTKTKCVDYGRHGSVCSYECGLRDNESKNETSIKPDSKKNNSCIISSEEYVDYMFNNWREIKELNEYFTVFKKNLKELIMQHQTFNLKM